MNNAIESFLNEKKPITELTPYLAELMGFIPEHTAEIMGRIINKVINLLGTGNIPRDLKHLLIAFLFKALREEKPDNPATDPYKALFSNQDFLSNLFLHAGLDSNGNFDMHVIKMFQNYLIVKEGAKVAEFLKESHFAVHPLMHGCARNKDKKASLLFHQLAVCHPDVLSALIDDIKPNLRQFSVQLMIDLMISSPELKETMSQEEFEEWILQQDLVTMSDANQAFAKLFTGLWQKPVSIQIMLMTEPATDPNQLAWIHGMPPQTFEMPDDIAAQAGQALTSPKYKFVVVRKRDRRVGQTNKTIETDTRDTYNFARLYILSLCRPEQVSPECRAMVGELVSATNDSVAAAALQVLISWAHNWGYELPNPVVFRIAAEIDSTRNEGLRHLYRLALVFCARTSTTADCILRAEPSVRYDAKNKVKIKRESWVFPQMIQVVLDAVDDSANYDRLKVLGMLGYVMEYLNVPCE